MDRAEAPNAILGTDAPTRGRYWPELDGLRALAVIVVIAFHCELDVVRGGAIGVDIFFTLSGFLITSVLLDEWTRRNTFALGRFYLRRILRLYPALVVCLIGTLVIARLVGGSTWVDTRDGSPFALTYTLNWFAIERYYGLVAHTWSLAVEEQFYLLWPLVLMLALRWRGLAGALIAAVSITVVAAIATPFINDAFGFEHIYRGLDARAPQLLVGAAAAILYAHRRPGVRLRRVLLVGAWAAIGAIAIAAWKLAANTAAFRFGGYTGFALLVAMLVVHLVDRPARPFVTVFGARPAIAIGRISYGMYLWHYPIALTLHGRLPSLSPVLVFAVTLPATIGIAWLSYRLVEQPFLRLKRRLEPDDRRVVIDRHEATLAPQPSPDV